jgi:hypothetical protein
MRDFITFSELESQAPRANLARPLTAALAVNLAIAQVNLAIRTGARTRRGIRQEALTGLETAVHAAGLPLSAVPMVTARIGRTVARIGRIVD